MDENYWNNLYQNRRTGWDIGYASPPITNYIDQLTDKNIKILIPGAGRAWEVEYLFNNGFKNVFMLDIAENAIKEFTLRCPDFPEKNIIREDFFKHTAKYDLIIEQTFFSSILPDLRNNYVDKIYNLLNDSGKLVGLLFGIIFPFEAPPYGGNIDEYRKLFQKKFNFVHFDTANNSIKPRKGNELFILLEKKKDIR